MEGLGKATLDRPDLPRVRFFGEAVVIGGISGICALGITYGLGGGENGSPLSSAVKGMGFLLAIGVLATFPAFFEEIAFRGLVLGRLSALFGGSLGAWVAGIAFALAHGISLSFPLLFASGVYLSFFRLRSGASFLGFFIQWPSCLPEHGLNHPPKFSRSVKMTSLPAAKPPRNRCDISL